MDNKEKMDIIVEALEALKTLKRLEAKIKSEDKKEKEDIDVSKVFSKECELHVTIKGDEENLGSESCVEFKGCKSLADQTIIAVSVLSSIVENMDKKEAIDYLAHLCTLVIAGENAGIYKSKPNAKDEEEEEEE